MAMPKNLREEDSGQCFPFDTRVLDKSCIQLFFPVSLTDGSAGGLQK